MPTRVVPTARPECLFCLYKRWLLTLSLVSVIRLEVIGVVRFLEEDHSLAIFLVSKAAPNTVKGFIKHWPIKSVAYM